MKCPQCGDGEDKVIESRQNQSGTTIRRRRECQGCGLRFTSYERIEEEVLTVIKRSGRREPFDINKIEHCLERVMGKRPIDQDKVEEFLNSVEDEIIMLGYSTQEIRSENLRDLMMKRLYFLDKVVYVRFASVYCQFDTIREFMRVITESEFTLQGHQRNDEEGLGKLF